MRRADPWPVPIFARPLPALLLALLLAACGGPGGGGGGDVACGDRIGGNALASAAAVGFAGNTNAVLNGSPYGDSGASDATVRCNVPLAATGDARGFTFGDATITRRNASSSGVYITVPVRNDGAARCFVEFSDTELLGRNGGVLVREETDFVQGSVANPSGVFTDTCLDEGETGYLFNIFSDGTLFDRVARVRIGAVDGDAVSTAPALSVQPQGYQVAADGGSLATTVRNEGGGDVALGNASLYIRLDADGVPYGWSFFDDPTASTLAPGASTVFSDSVAFDGSATGMHAYVDAVPAGAALRAPSDARAASTLEPRERWRLRNARAAAQEAAFRERIERGR